jgi:hypothetical protein
MNSRRLTGSPLRVGRRQTTTPSRARMLLCAKPIGKKVGRSWTHMAPSYMNTLPSGITKIAR